MEKINFENIEKTLYMYALYDKELDFYFSLASGYNNESTCSYYLQTLKDCVVTMKKDLSKNLYKETFKKFIDKVRNCCVYRIAYFNDKTGQFVNESLFLMDFFDITEKDLILEDNDGKKDK